MKNKWLIGLATGILSVSLCVGMFGCVPEGGEGKTDEEIAQAAIDLVGTLSKDIPSTTSDNFEVVGQVPVEKVYYDVVWTVTSDDVDGITDYVSIGTMNETTKFRPVTVTKYETAIDYTLTATVTVNKATKKADFVKHLPAAPRAGAGTKDDPFTVSEALELAAATASYSYYSVDGEYALVYVRGVITQAPTGENLTNKYGPKDFYIGDSADAEATIQVYSVNWTETVPSGSVLCDGDTVLVQAYIQNYNGKYELTYWREGDQSPYTYHNGYIHELTPGPNHTDTPPTPPTPDSSFTPLETPAAGEYDFAMAVDGTWNYITGEMASTYYFGTTTNHSSAAKVTLEADGNNWVIKLGEKYIEISISGTHINAVYSATKNGNWSWDTTEKVFVWTVGSEKYIIGNTGTYTNIGGIKLSDKATNHYAVLGNYTGTTTDPTAKGTKNNPYTVAEATEILHTLSNGEYYKVDGVVVPVYIKGIITVVGTTDNYGIKQFYIADTADDTDNDVVIWSINWSTAVPSTTKLQVGDTIVVNAYLEYYQSTYQICSWKDGSVWHNGTVEEHIPAGGSVTPGSDTGITEEDGTVKLDIAKYAAANSWADSTAYTEIRMGTNITVTVSGSSNTGKYYNNGNNWRIYQNESPTLTFTAVNGITIVSVKITYTNKNTGILKSKTADTTYASNEVIAVNAATVSFTVGNTVSSTTNGQVQISAIEVVYSGTAAELTNQQKADAVKNSLTLTETTFDTIGDEVDLPTTNDYDAVVVWTVKTSTDLVKIEGNKLTVEKLPDVSTKVTLHVAITVGSDGTAEKDVEITISPAADLSKYGTKDAPLTVTQALAIATEECANSNDVTKQIVYAKGIALSTPEASGTYYKQFELRDETDTTKKIIVYTISLDANVPAIAQNDIIIIHGYIKNYSGTIEFASNGSTYVYCVSNTRGESTITLGNHDGATVTGISTGDKKTNGTEVTFSVTAEAGKKIVSVKANGTALTATENSYKFTVQGDTTVTVETAGENEAVAELLYSLNSTEQPVGSNNTYDRTCEVKYKNVTWVVNGNAKVDQNGAQKPWRFGGKSITGVDRKLTGKTAISGKISKITLQLTDGGSITVNSVTLKVYKSDPTVSGAQVVSTKSVNYQKGVAVDIMAGEDDWTNCFFEIVFNLTVSDKNKNKYVSIDKFEFYGTPAE